MNEHDGTYVGTLLGTFAGLVVGVGLLALGMERSTEAQQVALCGAAGLVPILLGLGGWRLGW